MSQTSIAFALGGLGGFNAHGVGFLKAALDKGIEPQLISCSSGQIYWTWRYLMQKTLSEIRSAASLLIFSVNWKPKSPRPTAFLISSPG